MSRDKEALLTILPVDIVDKIIASPLPLYPTQDEFVWGPSGSDTFTVKSASWLQSQQVHAHSKASLLNEMWKLNLHPKVMIFAWILIRNRLRTRDKLSTYNHNISPLCPFCTNSPETVDHLFMQCPFSHQVWTLTHFSNPLQWNDSFISWNRLIFQRLVPSPNKTLFGGVMMGTNYCQANPKNSQPKLSKYFQVKWQPPNSEQVKLNFDGFVRNGSATIGFVIWNSDGNPLVVANKRLGHSSVLIAEAIALRDGLHTVLLHHYPNISVEGDSKLATDRLHSRQNYCTLEN
ncbi:uncharacterized protein LOC133711526 [Rosa rugosa]|uniref:uncharacterized protein LOC133711526 n=1 Tax=Rosa rugosa TaxID=74645 RepID=UPI002B408AE3|nr:uncharacterized protein LOC133711526 [Rosa rugosa]